MGLGTASIRQPVTLPAVQENGGWDLSAIGLKLRDPDLPFEDFCDLCWMLGRFHEAVRFAIGDALNSGPELYGEQAYQAFEQLQLSEAGMMEYARVARQVPFSRRRKGLSWSHHRAVASLEPPEQKEWLRRAADENLSHHALRDALRAEGVQPPAASPLRCRCCGNLL